MKNLISAFITLLAATATACAWLYNSVIAVTFMKVLLCLSVPLALLTLVIIGLAVVLKPDEAGEKMATELKWWSWPLQVVANLNQIATTTYFLSLGATGWALLAILGLGLSLSSVGIICWAIDRYRAKAKRAMANTLKQAMAEEQRRFEAAKPANVLSVK